MDRKYFDYEEPVSLRCSFAVDLSLVFTVLCLPASFALRIYPEILDFFAWIFR